MSSTSKEPKEVKESSSSKDRKRTKKVVKTETVSRSSSPESKKSRNVSDASKQNARAIFFHEENTVDKRNPLDDLKKHSQVCDEFRNILSSIKAIKDKGPTSNKDAAKLEELRVQGTLQFVDLRKLNRVSHFRCKKVRDSTHERKQQIDHQHLQLQNLLYEVMHLQKEITKCLQFKSNDEDVNLVMVDDFYKDAPPEISKSEITKKDLHQQTLARLDWELTQRKKLSEKLKERQNVKDEMKGEIQIKDDFLDSLQPKLNTILQATKPVQEYLGMPFDEIREQHRSAAYLPRPLYVLFMQASAYRDACDKNLQVAIEGEVEEAKSLENTTIDLGKAEEDSDSEGEDQEKEGSKKRRRRTTETKAPKDCNNKMLKRHPLNVVLHIKCKDGGSVTQLTFHYMMVLEIVTLTLKIQKGTENTATTLTGGDLLSTDSILNYLYPDDLGTDTPNPSNNYALQKYGLGEIRLYLNQIGRPYQWVQWLCGLQFLAAASDKSPKSAQPAVSATHMEDTIKQIRRRLKARLSLQHQLASFEKHSVPVSAECMNLFPTKITARLASWSRSYYDDFATMPYCQSIIQANLARETDMYFIAVIERGSAKMTAHIVLPCEYPVCPPVFAVSILWKTERNNTNDPNIRDLESEINVHYADLLKDKSHDQLLTNQLQRLLSCFDVYLETETEQVGQEQGPSEFGKEKIFPRTSKGPARGKPYVYNAELGFFGQR